MGVVVSFAGEGRGDRGGGRSWVLALDSPSAWTDSYLLADGRLLRFEFIQLYHLVDRKKNRNDQAMFCVRSAWISSWGAGHWLSSILSTLTW